MVEYIASALSVYVAPALVVMYIAPAPAVYETLVGSTLRQYHQCTLHLHLSLCTLRQHQQCTKHLWCCTSRCAPVPVIKDITPAQAVLRRASSGTGILCNNACCLCRTYCDCKRWLCFSPCRAHRLHKNFGGVHRAGISSICCTCTCRLKHRAGASSVTAPAPVMVYIALAQTVSYAAQAQVLEYFAPAVSASAGPFATATGSSILSLSCPPSTLAHVVEYIAPAPAVYAAPAPVMVYLALAQAVSYAAQAQVLEYFAPAFSASAGPFATATGSSILSLSCPPSTLALWVEYIAPAPAVYAAPAPVMV